MKHNLTAAHAALHEAAHEIQKLEQTDPKLGTVLRLLGKAVEHTLYEVESLSQGQP